MLLVAGCSRGTTSPGRGDTGGADTGGAGEAGAGGSAGSGGQSSSGGKGGTVADRDAGTDAGASEGPVADVAVDLAPDRDSDGRHAMDAGDGGVIVGGIRHPGLVSSGAELDAIRAVILNGPADHPMKVGWAKLRATRFAQLTYQATPYAIVRVAGSGTTPGEGAMRNDAVAAYAHALQWAVLQDPRYSAKAIEIMRAWSSILQDVVPETAADPQVQDELEVAWYAPQWLNAAEIIRYHHDGAAAWSKDDRASFDRMVALFKAKADAWAGSANCCPNQGVSVALSRMSIGVYTSDRKYFDDAATFFTGKMLGRAISPIGEVIEINRSPGGDCSHATFNIEGIFDLAETAWHQGTDLYASAPLARGLEYLAQLLTTGAPTTSEGTVTCGTRPSSIEIGYNHYTNRAHQPALPRTMELLTKLRPVDQGTGKFIPWDTLTHAQLDR
jgi:hypothetical protein